MTNKIDHTCECGHTESDVQCKISKSFVENDKTKTIIQIQIKCLKCRTNHFLDESDDRCKKYFKN